MTNSTEIQTLALAIAEELGHEVKITTTDASTSEKLGRQIRVRLCLYKNY